MRRDLGDIHANRARRRNHGRVRRQLETVNNAIRVAQDRPFDAEVDRERELSDETGGHDV